MAGSDAAATARESVVGGVRGEGAVGRSPRADQDHEDRIAPHQAKLPHAITTRNLLASPNARRRLIGRVSQNSLSPTLASDDLFARYARVCR